MKPFEHWDSLFKSEKLEEFNHDPQGVLWLKLKSIIRIELIKEFLEFSELSLRSIKLNENFQELFDILSRDILQSYSLLNNYISSVNKTQIAKVDIPKLVSQLYKLRNFD